jgi:2-polyprenyl-3-methyl-5-hydroxy-6-metoxy-1,4-benzoquinol methylase
MAGVTKRFIEYGGHRFHERAHPDAYELALGIVPTLPRGRALDLGAGAGLTSFRIRESGFHVVAADVNAEQFVPKDICCHKIDLDQPLPFAEGEFDLVMALEIVEHLESPRAFLREVARVLRPGGTLILSTPNIVSWQSKWRFLFRSEFTLFFNASTRVRDPFCEEASGHISPLLPWLLDSFLQDAGFEPPSRRFTRCLGIRSRCLAQTVVLQTSRLSA